MTGLPRLVFDYPWLLVTAPLLPAVVLWLRMRRRNDRNRRLAGFAERDALLRLVGKIGGGGKSRTVILMLVMALAGIALAGPRWGAASDRITTRGIDIVLAIDASLSMLAEDEHPSRLERVKQEIRRLRAMSRADRVALIAFAGRSYILTPLTTDDGALELFLDNLDPSTVGQAGSALAPAIRQGTDLLLASDGSADKALVIFSDGEAFDDRDAIVAAARDVNRKGISLVTVGFGSTRGSTIPIRDGSVTRPKRNEDGNIVVTSYTPEFLRAAAMAADGTFIPADATDKASRIRAALRSLRSARRTVDAREEHIPRFLWLLVPALLLLAYDSARGERNRTPRSSSSQRRARGSPSLSRVSLVAASLILGCQAEPDPAALFSGGDVSAALDILKRQIESGDSSAVALYNLGSALLGSDSLTAAAQLLNTLRFESTGEVQMRSRYNAGLSYLRIGRLTGGTDANSAMEAARAALRSLLEARPDDIEAKWNYELALKVAPRSGGGGSSDPDTDRQPPEDDMSPRALDQQQADALLNSAAREERDVQRRRQRKARTAPQGKDW